MNFTSSTASPAGASGTQQSLSQHASREVQQHVGESRDRLSDEEREAAIHRAGKAIEHHMALYAASSNLADRGDADRARLLMQQLIAGRSAAFVAKLELERGLSRA
jgi:hypothetical protein